MKRTRDDPAIDETSRGEEKRGSDVVASYRREIQEKARLTRAEEVRLAEEMAIHRAEIRDRLLAVVLKAIDVLGLDAERRESAAERSIDDYADEIRRLRAASSECSTSTPHGLRHSILHELTGTRLNALETKLTAVVALARRQWQAMRDGQVRGDPVHVARARDVLDAIRAGFGVAAEELDHVSVLIEERRRRYSAAREALVEGNLRLVVYLANRSKFGGVEVGDLVQEGNIALMRAAETFDPSRGVAFATFACMAIRRAMHRFAESTSRPVHVPNDVRARRRLISQTARHLSDADGRSASWQSVADYLDVPLRAVVDALSVSEASVPLDHGLDDDRDSVADRFADGRCVDAAEAASDAEWDRLVERSVAELSERERSILRARFGLGDVSPATLADVGRALGVTRERARQLEARALRNLRRDTTAPQRTGRPPPSKRRSF
jgi:RNA polymerase sigma factor (sigma-70 family)